MITGIASPQQCKTLWNKDALPALLSSAFRPYLLVTATRMRRAWPEGNIHKIAVIIVC
jgi:hypothetical protein